MNRQQLGKITLPAELIENNPKLVADMFASLQCIVVKAEMSFAMRSLEYTIISQRCEEVPFNVPPCHYDIELGIWGNTIPEGTFKDVKLVKGQLGNKYTLESEEDMEDPDMEHTELALAP